MARCVRIVSMSCHDFAPWGLCRIHGVLYRAPMTEVLSSSADGIARAAALLRAGALVAFGTETVYGLGGAATNAEAVAAIFAAKQRPRFNPLICHYASAARAFADVEPNPLAHTLAASFWPGPLTLVLPRLATCRVP